MEVFFPFSCENSNHPELRKIRGLVAARAQLPSVESAGLCALEQGWLVPRELYEHSRSLLLE